jgi:CheY-like chemotaxis protein
MGLLYRRYCSSVAEIVDDSRSLPETDFPQLSFPELPANTSVSVAQPPVPITSPPSSNHEDIVAHSPTRLLIVDDDHVNRRITVQLAQRSGFLSMDAKDGWDAMLILARNMSCSLRLLFQEGNLSLAYYDASLSALQQICQSRIMQLIRNGKVDAKQQQDALDALNRLGSEPAPAYETVVVEIHCGSQVLCVLRWFLLDVALVDQNMPIMNGSDFAQLVRDVESSVASIVQEDPQFMKFLTRARCSLVQLALVRFSADTLFDEEDIFTDALPKPCRKAELEAKLREVANRFLPSINAHSSTELVMN